MSVDTLRFPDRGLASEPVVVHARFFVIVFSVALMLIWLLLSFSEVSGTSPISREAGVLIVAGVGALSWLSVELVWRRAWDVVDVNVAREWFMTDFFVTAALVELPAIVAFVLYFRTAWIGTYVIGVVVTASLFYVAAPSARRVSALVARLEAERSDVDFERAFYAPRTETESLRPA